MPTRVLDANRRSTKATTLIEKFKRRIVGQDAGVDALVRLYEKFQSGLYNKDRPIGVVMALGPTGTGKTLIGEAFAEGLFGNVKHMMKVDCAEFQHSHEIAKLVGSPPGYLGHRETHPFFTNNSLIEARSNNGTAIQPFTIIQWDEVEKASDSLWNLLLGIFDKGELTTGTNERVTEMRNTIHLLTSNVGASEMADDDAIGFYKNEVVDDAKLSSIANAAARRKFAPEFLNRVDEIINFKTLAQDDLRQILSLELGRLQDRIIIGSNTLFELRVSNRGMEQLLTEGYDKRYNARHLKRTIEKNLALPLARLVSTGQIMDEDIVMCHFKDDVWSYMAVARRDVFGEKSLASSVSAG